MKIWKSHRQKKKIIKKIKNNFKNNSVNKNNLPIKSKTNSKIDKKSNNNNNNIL